MITVFITVYTPSQINVTHTLPNLRHILILSQQLQITLQAFYFSEIFWKALLLISLP
jgi:hypothetical protein